MEVGKKAAETMLEPGAAEKERGNSGLFWPWENLVVVMQTKVETEEEEKEHFDPKHPWESLVGADFFKTFFKLTQLGAGTPPQIRPSDGIPKKFCRFTPKPNLLT
eukprot:EG_transcript_9624